MSPPSIPSTLPPGPSSIQITHRTDKSVLMRVLHTCIRPFAPQLMKVKETYPPGSPSLDVPKSMGKYCNVTHRVICDMNVYEIEAKQDKVHHTRPDVTKSGNDDDEKELPHEGRRRIIYYFAGGGWRTPANSEHWALIAEFARKLPDTTVCLVSYPLAPNSPAPQAFPALQRFYRGVLSPEHKLPGQSVVLAGDSAGGNIALALTLAAVAEDHNAPVPEALMLLSPSADCRRSNPDIQKVAPRDPILRVPFINETAKGWRGDWGASDSRVSPLLVDNAAVKALAARGVLVHGVTGTHDILAPDAVLFRDLCGREGVKGEWLDWEGQMHVFPLAYRYGLRESREAKDWIVEVLSRC